MSARIFDLHHDVKATKALSHQTINSDTTTDGDIIDTAGFEALEFVFLSGTITDGSYTVALEQGDESDLSDAAAVPAADVLGAAVFAAADDNVAKRIGCLFKKRYVRASVVSTDTTSGGSLGGVAILGQPLHAPVAD